MTASSPDPIDDTRAIDCPRCGYDQRGVIATWTETCPLEGVCSECGLTFTWREVLLRDQLAPKWSVEFTPRRRGLPWATMKTFVRTLWPWGFWKRMNMAYEIHWLRIVAYLLILLTPMLAGYVAAQSIAATIALSRYRQAFNANRQMAPAMMAQVNTMRYPSRFRGAGLPSMRIAETAEVDAWRSRTFQALQQEILTPSYIDHSYAAAIFEAVFTPLSDETSGRIFYPSRAPPGTAPNPASSMASIPFPITPAQIWTAVAAPPNTMMSGTYGRSIWRDVAPGFSVVLFWTLMLLVPFPLSLALLPVTRRKAKVRWAHIARVFGYSLSIPIVFAELMLAVWLVAKLGWSISALHEETWMVPAAFGMPVITMCWWGAAIRNYLRLPHAAAVTVVMSVLCVLLTGGAAFWISTVIWG